MVEKYNIRTDLALEEKERFESDHVEVQGVILTEEYDEENEIRITTVRIETENGAKVMGKPVGSYITIEAPEMAVPDEGYHEEISQQLRKFIGELLPKRKMEKILVVGLGNRQVTPDALGPYVVDNLHITRHIIEEYGKYATGEDEVWSVRYAGAYCTPQSLDAQSFCGKRNNQYLHHRRISVQLRHPTTGFCREHTRTLPPGIGNPKTPV